MGAPTGSVRARTAAVLRTAVAGGVVVALSACLPYSGNREGPRIAITGDSNTSLLTRPNPLAEQGAIAEVLHPVFRTTVQAKSGFRIAGMLGALREQVDNKAGRPDGVVIYLGTNDVIGESTTWRAAFDEMLSIVGDVPCVELVTVNSDTDRHFGQTEVTAAAINAAIAEAAAAEPDRIHVIAWDVPWLSEMGPPNPEVTEHPYSVFVPPEQLDDEKRALWPDGVWVGDGIHQSPEGSLALARLYRDELIADCFPELAEG